MSANPEQIRNLSYNLRPASADLDALFQGHDSLTPLESAELFLLEQQRLRAEKQSLIRRKRANLPRIKTLDSFDFGFRRSASKERMLKLCDMTRVEQACNILFLGPPGVGKTHLALSLALRGLDTGYSVAFETLSSLMIIPKTAEFAASGKRRLQYLCKATLVVVDEVGFRPLEPVEANLFFTFISAMSEKNFRHYHFQQGL